MEFTMEYSEVMKIINRKLKSLKRERDRSSGGDYCRNYRIVELKIEAVEDVKREIKRLKDISG